MAIIHHQFETIHPFYDGNGRTGRIINILYLILEKLLDTPVLYLSGYIIDEKQESKKKEKRFSGKFAGIEDILARKEKEQNCKDYEFDLNF